jgi:iron complex outermembrane receptor protein
MATVAVAADTTGGIEEVTVTASRFASALQTTPIAISAINADTLEQRKISNILESSAAIPGIMMTPVTGASSGARIFMRGVGNENTAILFDNAVGVYIDGVYQPRINGQFFDFFDVGRVEILRGPQGTLYGRNSDGGAIKLITKSPSLNEFKAMGDLTYGNYQTADQRLYLSAPISDTLAGSISAVSRKRNGIMKNPNYDRPVNNKDQQGLRAKLLWQPSDAFSAELGFMHLADHGDAGMGSAIQSLGGLGVVNPNAVPGRNLLTSEFSGPQFNRGSNDGAQLNMAYSVSPNLTLNSISGWGFQRVDFATNFIQTASGLNIGSSYQFTDHFLSQELNGTYTSDKFKGVAGLYYYSEKGHQQDVAPYTSVAGRNFRDRITDATAAFAEGTYNLTDTFGATVGLRYTHEKADLTQWYFNQVITPAPQNAKQTFSATTPKFGVNWQATDNMFVYASYTKGFKSGGFNAVSPATNTGVPGAVGRPTEYGPERVTSYEAGLKYHTIDRRFVVNLAVFEADYVGLQLPVFFPGTSNSYTQNATGGRVRGIEIEPTWQATDDLRIYAMGSFEDDKYTKPFNCSLYNTQIVNCQDKHIKGVIPVKTDLGVEYRLPVKMPGELRMNAEWQHNGKYFNNVSNTLPIVATPSADIFNASVWWDSEDSHWRVALEAKNIMNKIYALESLQIASAIQPSITVYPNEPRMVDVRVRFNF